MEIKTLENTSVAEITSVFNEAFQGYFIPLVFTGQTMAAKIKSEGILLHYSVGAFEEGKLVGFILHAFEVINGVKTIYNAGTGVIAPFRGRGLTEALYRYCIPLLKQHGIGHHVLEVIDNNAPAIKIYRKIGFREMRSLAAYKGSLPPKDGPPFLIKEIDRIPGEMVPLFELEPAWQNAVASVYRDITAHTMVGVFSDGELVGFAAFVPTTARVKVCFVQPAHRRKGIGTALLHYMQQASTATQLVLTNIDESYRPANLFLQALGFQHFLSLYEMKMEVK